MPDLNESVIETKERVEKVEKPVRQPVNASKWEKLNIPDEVLLNKEKAFELFKTNYQSTQAFEDNKNLLKDKIKEAKN